MAALARKDPMSDARFNCVAILDAIPQGELNTARRNYDALRDIAAYESTGLEVRYFRADSIEAIRSAVSSLMFEVTSKGLLPWLHLEGHGANDESGFLTADNNLCTWTQLKDIILPLNVATNLNLLLVLATCFGGSFARAITTVDRAPVLGLIGPTREIKIGDVEADFPSFYRTFFSTRSLRQAVSALTSRASHSIYYRTTATKFFCEVWVGYKSIQCAPAQMHKRARSMYRELKARNLPKTPSVGRLKRLLASEEERQFNGFRDRYFMYDLHPLNRGRFPVTYKNGEANIAR
jgi:hypothetical protein